MAAVRYAYVRNELSPGTAWSRGPKDVMGCTTSVTQWVQALPGRGAQRQLYLVPNARNALAAGLARKIQKEFIFLPLDIFSTL